jgi:hypothetical protein
MNEGILTVDEYDALTQIRSAQRSARPSACVARNSKRLVGLKYIAHQKAGSFILTEKGKQTLFVKACVDGLRALSADTAAPLSADVATFLGKKGHIAAAEGGGYTLTARGSESLADILATEAAR